MKVGDRVVVVWVPVHTEFFLWVGRLGTVQAVRARSRTLKVLLEDGSTVTGDARVFSSLEEARG